MRLFFTLCLSLTGLSLMAQQPAEPAKYRIPKLAVKWSPLHLIDHYPTFQIALEHRFTPNYSLQYDFGPVLNFRGIRIESDSRKRGYKARLQGRRYFPSPASRHWEFFAGAEFHYYNIRYEMGETYRVRHSSGIEYYQFIGFDRNFVDKGFGIQGGTVFKAYRFLIDFQIGVAARFVRYNSYTRPDQNTHTFINDDDGPDFLQPLRNSRDLISPTGCIRFCYVIR